MVTIIVTKKCPSILWFSCVTVHQGTCLPVKFLTEFSCRPGSRFLPFALRAQTKTSLRLSSPDAHQAVGALWAKKFGPTARDNPNFTAPTKRGTTDGACTNFLPFFFQICQKQFLNWQKMYIYCRQVQVSTAQLKCFRNKSLFLRINFLHKFEFKLVPSF